MDKTLTVGGRSVFYRDLGVGTPVLLLHGLAEDGAIWDEVAKTLSGMCRVLIPDVPGSGRSDLPADEVSMESLAAVIREIMDAEGIDRCVFIGHSMGGYIALAFAESYQQRVTALGLFHSTAYADSDEKKAGRRKSIGFIREHGVTPYIRQSTPNLFAAGTREERPALVEEMVRRYSTFPGGSLTAYLEAMLNRPDRLHVLERFPRPILLIIGEQDQIIPMEQSLKQAHIPQIAQVSLLPDAGHMGMLEAPDAGSAIIREFLNFITLS